MVGGVARNGRLANAIRQRGWDTQRFAQEIEVDPKTVGRWVSTGRTPHPRLRARAAEQLGVPMAVLWPEADALMNGMGDLVGLYTTRAEVSPSSIRTLSVGANQHIDILAYAGLWLWDTVPGFAEVLATKISEGVAVRVCLGDPDSAAVLQRGDEEGIGANLAARCRLATGYARVIADADPTALRWSAATLYASILRFDQEVLVNMHLWGNPACSSPVLCLRHQSESGVAANVIRSFERVWQDAQPVRG
jgi:transcriptional regulator with XRE-family HTH domain